MKKKKGRNLLLKIFFDNEIEMMPKTTKLLHAPFLKTLGARHGATTQPYSHTPTCAIVSGFTMISHTRPSCYPLTYNKTMIRCHPRYSMLEKSTRLYENFVEDLMEPHDSIHSIISANTTSRKDAGHLVPRTMFNIVDEGSHIDCYRATRLDDL